MPMFEPGVSDTSIAVVGFEILVTGFRAVVTGAGVTVVVVV